MTSPMCKCGLEIDCHVAHQVLGRIEFHPPNKPDQICWYKRGKSTDLDVGSSMAVAELIAINQRRKESRV